MGDGKMGGKDGKMGDGVPYVTALLYTVKGCFVSELAE